MKEGNRWEGMIKKWKLRRKIMVGGDDEDDDDGVPKMGKIVIFLPEQSLE